MITKLSFKEAEFKRELEEMLDQAETTLDKIDEIAENYYIQPLFRLIDDAKADLNHIRRLQFSYFQG